MPIGENIALLKDKLIKKTTGETRKASNTNIINKIGQPSRDPEADTYKTIKMTFYVKDNLLKRLYNFAYWDRHSLTEAFNIVIADGLRGKNTRPKEVKELMR